MKARAVAVAARTRDFVLTFMAMSVVVLALTGAFHTATTDHHGKALCHTHEGVTHCHVHH